MLGHATEEDLKFRDWSSNKKSICCQAALGATRCYMGHKCKVLMTLVTDKEVILSIYI